MDRAGEHEPLAASLADWLAALTFVDQETDAVTALLVESVAGWADAMGWRVYRRAPSVLPLPAPYAHQHSFLDLGCARPVGAPIAIEIDRTGRRRSIDKLLAESAAGRIAIWVRWGSRRFEPPPPPISMVTCRVASRTQLGGGSRLHSRLPSGNRPAPMHTVVARTDVQQAGLSTEPGLS